MFNSNRLFCVVSLFLLAANYSFSMENNNNAPQQSSSQESSFMTRVWQSIFGGSDSSQSNSHVCDNCKNNPNSSNPLHVQNAFVVPGSGGQSSGLTSPTTIANMYGSPNSGSQGMSAEAMIALEKEKTKQLEIAASEKLQTEHERSKWFATLVEYADQRFSAEAQKTSDQAMKQARELMEEHHTVLRDLETKRSENELEKERLHQEKLPTLLEHDLAKTKLLHEQALEKLAHIGQGIMHFTQDKQRMLNTTAACSALALGVYSAKRGTNVVAKYLQALLMKPRLVTETSRKSIGSVLRAPLTLLKKREDPLPPVVYNAELQKNVDCYIQSVVTGIREGLPFRHALLYGPPGTGKTLLAKFIAAYLSRSLDKKVHYAIIPGSNIHQFSDKEAVQELNKLFDWAERGNTLLFLDEVDAFAPKRTGETSEQSRKIQNTFYARTGTETNKFLLLAATNEPGLLDNAFKSRMDEHIEFPLPDQATRLTLLQKHFETFVLNRAKVSVDKHVFDMWPEVALQLAGFSGREISQFVRALPAHAGMMPDKTITPELIRNVVQQKINQKTVLTAFKTV